jgi:phospholipase C
MLEVQGPQVGVLLQERSVTEEALHIMEPAVEVDITVVVLDIMEVVPEADPALPTTSLPQLLIPKVLNQEMD